MTQEQPPKRPRGRPRKNPIGPPNISMMGSMANGKVATEEQVRKRILTDVKENFAQAYVANGGDAAAAYELVVPNPDRLPVSTSQAASVMRHSPEVEERIQELRERASKPFAITAQMVVLRALDIALSDARDRIPALNIVAKFFPEFKEGTNVDARSLNLQLPPGTTLQDLQGLRDQLLKQVDSSAALPELPAPAAEEALQGRAYGPAEHEVAPESTSEF